MSILLENIERELKVGDRLKPVTECALYKVPVSNGMVRPAS